MDGASLTGDTEAYLCSPIIRSGSANTHMCWVILWHSDIEEKLECRVLDGCLSRLLCEIYQLKHPLVPPKHCAATVNNEVGMRLQSYLDYLSRHTFPIGHLIEYMLVLCR